MKLNNSLALSLSILAAAKIFAANTNDNPLPPTNAHAQLGADYTTVTVTWDAPGTVGESGGVVDPAEITYYIFDAFASYYDPAIAVTTATSYTFDYSPMQGQDFVAYQITAGVNEVWYSLATNTNIVCIGAPAQLPVAESFANGKQTLPWCVDPYGSWTSSATTKKDRGAKIDGTAISSYDADNGYLFFTTKNEGDTYGIISEKVIAGSVDNPTLKFVCQGRSSTIDVLVSVEGDEFAKAYTIDLAENPLTEWKEYTCDLSAYADAAYIQLELLVTATEANTSGKWGVAIDAISIASDIVDSTTVVAADTDSPTEIYTLDGRKVTTAHPAPGIYIERRGEKTSKIIVR